VCTLYVTPPSVMVVIVPPVPTVALELDAFRDRVETERSTAPGVTVIDCVTAVRDPDPNDMVYAVPAVPRIPNVENVAIPFEATAVVVPTVPPPDPLTVAVTVIVEFSTRFPAESSTRTTGCVVNTEPDAVPSAAVPSESEAAAPCTTVTECESLVRRVPLVKVAE